jgi:hypothetical protein
MKTLIASNIKHKTSVSILNELFARLDCSLARYLSYARPWVRRRNMLLDAVVRRLSYEHEIYASNLARLIVDRRGAVRSSVFPMGFTSYNDLSLEYLAPKLLDDERALIVAAEDCANRLNDDPEARRIVEKIAASLRRYASLLAELLAPSRIAPRPTGADSVTTRREKARSRAATERYDEPAMDTHTAA